MECADLMGVTLSIAAYGSFSRIFYHTHLPQGCVVVTLIT